MRNRGAILVAALALAGCAHTVYVTGRTTGVSGQTTITPGIGQTSGKIGLKIGGKAYAGRWVYMNGPGSVSIGSAIAVSGATSASAFGTGVAAPMSGNGSIIMSAPGGGSFRCVFNYSQWSSSGVGECQDETGEIYDLQITK